MMAWAMPTRLPVALRQLADEHIALVYQAAAFHGNLGPSLARICRDSLNAAYKIEKACQRSFRDIGGRRFGK